MVFLIFILLFIIFVIIVAKETPEEWEMNALSILTALVKGGMTPIAACAMGGNMIAESGMKSVNLQDSYQKTLGYTDETYTSSVDSGNYTRANFVADAAGYGLCQWTWHTRKAALYDFAKTRWKSIGDEGMQVAFCLAELAGEFPALWGYLQDAENLYEATGRICKEYEQPAVNNIEERAKFANELYMSYGELLERVAVTGEKGEFHLDKEPAVEDAEPSSYIMGTVRQGEHTPEAIFMMAQLKKVGYDVMWDGLTNCLRDFQQKKGLEVDGVCGEKTWRELLK